MGKKLQVLIFFLILSFAVPSVVGLLIYHEVQSRVGFEMQGQYIPVPLLPSFYVRNASFAWDDHVELHSGNLKVEYDPLTFIKDRSLRIRLASRDIAIELQGKWAQMQGVEKEIRLEKFYADLEIGEDGLDEIYEVEAYSPVFQFSVKESV